MPCPTETQRFLMRAAELLHRYGTPSHRLERVMAKVSASLGTKGVFLYTPTTLIVSFTDEDNETTFLRRVDSGPIDISKLMRFDDILEQVEDGRMSVTQASEAFEQAVDAKPPFSNGEIAIACAVVCGCVAIQIGGHLSEALVASVLGAMFFIIGGKTSRWSWERGLFEPLVALLGASLALIIARFLVPLDDRLTTLASLVVLLPGLSLTVAITELSVGHMSSGVARLAGAVTTLFIIVMGVGLAWKVGAQWRVTPAAVEPLPPIVRGVALFLTPGCFAVLFQAQLRLWPLIYLASLTGVAAYTLTADTYGNIAAAFAGAFTVGCIANSYARIWDRPALIPSTPGMIMLVPGALGYRALTALLENQTLTGLDIAFQTALSAFSLAGGLLASGAFISPKRIL